MAKFDLTGVNLDYRMLTEQKVDAVKACLRKWGLILRRALKEESNLDSRSTLYRAIGFKVEVTSKRDLSGKVKLLVGILNPDSPVLKYLKFFLYGTRSHFAPVIYRGRYTGILGWARKKHLIYRKGHKWYWVSGKLKDRPFVGIPNQHNKPNDFFKRVYDRYDNDIKRELSIILGGSEIG